MRVTIVGRDRVTLPAGLADCERYSVETRTDPLQCHTGRDLGERWRGIPVSELITAAAMPDDTTHLLVYGAEDYRMCIDIRDAFEALLAYECDGEPLGEERGTTRLVGPGIDSTHSVKAIHRIEAIHLDADEDPTELETYEQTGPESAP